MLPEIGSSANAGRQAARTNRRAGKKSGVKNDRRELLCFAFIFYPRFFACHPELFLGRCRHQLHDQFHFRPDRLITSLRIGRPRRNQFDAFYFTRREVDWEAEFESEVGLIGLHCGVGDVKGIKLIATGPPDPQTGNQPIRTEVELIVKLVAGTN